jgi:PAS domain S-box-containing protein
MKLRTKASILWAAASISITATLAGILYTKLWEDRLASIEGAISKQLRDIEFSLSSFFDDVESDVNAMAANPIVRTRDDRGFTSFLQADEMTFRYLYGETEQKIIDIFNTYRLTHKYVSSVYMGRENGSFVRSHPRERPTRYDPRERPWYAIAKSNPDAVLETDAYPSVTTNDVNIGIVKALVDGAGSFYGVVGVDVTLANLTDYLLNFSVSPSGNLILIDDAGTVLAGRGKNMQSARVEEISPDLEGILMKGEGVASLELADGEIYVFFLGSKQPSWTIAALVPAKDISGQIRAPVLTAVIALIIGLFLLGGLATIGLNVLVIGPLGRFTEETRRVAMTSDLNRRIEIRSRDEIGALAGAYNGMIDSLKQARESLKKNESDLRTYRDHLEELVKKRTAELQEANEKLKKEIAERIFVQQALVEREVQYRDLVESANSIILRWLPDGTVVFFNRFAQSFFGYNEEEIVGQNIVGTIVAAEDSTGNDRRRLAADIVARPEAHVRNVNENTRKNGERVWVAWANKPILAKDGGIAEILSIGADITQLVRTERELRQAMDELARAKESAETADRLKSAFLATMSHELRTPLNSIIGFTGILLQGMVGPLNGEQRKQLDMVHGSAVHLLSLIGDVLDISKIEAGQLSVVSEPIQVTSSIRKVVEAVRPLAEKKGLRLDVEISPEVGTIYSDTRRLEQVLLNIMGNAVKFTEKGGVSVKCSNAADGIVVQVADTGIGIKKEDIDGMFKPFHQIDTGLSRKYEGTGLGLSISKKLVELLGGEIWVTSEVDKGSTFGFRLPIQRSQS